MNRLVLIGNGYDLAAGLKTSYEDFLVDYFKGLINKVADSLIERGQQALEDDSMAKIEAYYDSLNRGALDSILQKMNNIEDLFKHKMIRFSDFQTIEQWEKTKEVNTIGEPNRFDIKIKSKLLLQLLGDFNWKDIEGFYFEQLKKIYELEKQAKKRKVDSSEEIKKIRKDYLYPLNREFDQLKSEVIDYLCNIETQKDRQFNFIKQLKTPLEKYTFNSFFNKGNYTSKTNIEIKEIKFINFNYTFSLENSFDWIGEGVKFSLNDIIYIHGLQNKKEDIIFGYGDDTDPIYHELELTGEDEYLKHLKSFHYPLNKEYLELINFIEYDQFEIIIAGHSLGLSDRVLLKSIFEHNNCKRIRILHRRRDDEKQRIQSRYMALARHFDNKMIMRNKVATFDMEDKLH